MKHDIIDIIFWVSLIAFGIITIIVLFRNHLHRLEKQPKEEDAEALVDLQEMQAREKLSAKEEFAFIGPCPECNPNEDRCCG